MQVGGQDERLAADPRHDGRRLRLLTPVQRRHVELVGKVAVEVDAVRVGATNDALHVTCGGRGWRISTPCLQGELQVAMYARLYPRS